MHRFSTAGWCGDFKNRLQSTLTFQEDSWNLGYDQPYRLTVPSSHNHGSVKNGMSPLVDAFQIQPCFHCHDIP